VRAQKITSQVLFLILVPVLVFGQALFQNLGGQRAGTAVFPFLKIETSAYGAGMAGAGVALPRDAASVFYNPTSISHLPKRDVVLFHLDMPADIDYEYFAFSTPFGRVSHIGFSYGALHMEPMMETTEYMPFGTGKTFVFRDEFAALTYSLKLSDRFTFGTTVKYVHETIDDQTMGGTLLDFGTLYMTGFRSLRIASSLTNFGAQAKPTGNYSKTILNQDGEPVVADSLEYQSFSPPTTFRLGVGYEFLESDLNRLTASFQLTHPADNAETYAFGFEYLLGNVLSMRCGYVLNMDGFGLALGGGLRIGLPGGIKMKIDYAFTQTDYLTAPQRYSIGFTL
jgi:hypothetical protein